MNYPLRNLLRVRKLREDLANQNLVKAQNAVEAARQKVIQKTKELEDFKIWRKKEEKRLYDKIINKNVKRLDLDELRSEIAALKQRELDHEKAILDAESEVDKAKELLEEAKILYKAALLNVQKIEEHRVIWSEQDKREKQMMEDKELEEFRGIVLEF